MAPWPLSGTSLPVSRQAPDLRGALAHYIAVERCNVRAKQSVESRKQQQRILGRLAKCFRLFDQQTCPLRDRLGLSTAI
jgi:hypothetical protein